MFLMVVLILLILVDIIMAHRQRLSTTQTHKAPAAAVACCRGDRREQPTIIAPRPSPSARLAPHKAIALQTFPAKGNYIA